MNIRCRSKAVIGSLQFDLGSTSLSAETLPTITNSPATVWGIHGEASKSKYWFKELTVHGILLDPKN